jgi:hypothetical protein
VVIGGQPFLAVSGDDEASHIATKEKAALVNGILLIFHVEKAQCF